MNRDKVITGVFFGLIAAIFLAGYLAWHSAPTAAPRAGADFTSFTPTSVPSCSWPVRITGKLSREQAGLVRCYLRALARHSYPAMNDVAYRTYPGGIKITPADFTHAADARSGVATARPVSDNLVDPAAFPVIITFADGVRESVWMSLANPASGHSWRLEVATPR